MTHELGTYSYDATVEMQRRLTKPHPLFDNIVNATNFSLNAQVRRY
jgi:hypothetical protein